MSSEIPNGYLRVTQVLEPFSKLHLIDKEVVQRAADRGTRVHKFCTLYALNLLVTDVDHDCKPYFESFKTWFDNMVSKVLLAPFRINSAKYRLSGEFDLVVTLKGECKAVLLDLKTPASESPSWALQTAAYSMLLRDEAKSVVERRAALRLCKMGLAAAFVEYTDHDGDEKKYLNALELYRYFYG